MLRLDVSVGSLDGPDDLKSESGPCIHLGNRCNSGQAHQEYEQLALVVPNRYRWASKDGHGPERIHK
jgi:hypothetical protein